MPEDLSDRSSTLKAWMLMHQIRNLGCYLQDRIGTEHGLTVAQHTVLTAIKYLDDPVKVGDVGRWMGHKVNAASMIADRREVRLTITEKGEDALNKATPHK